MLPFGWPALPQLSASWCRCGTRGAAMKWSFAAGTHQLGLGVQPTPTSCHASPNSSARPKQSCRSGCQLVSSSRLVQQGTGQRYADLIPLVRHIASLWTSQRMHCVLLHRKHVQHSHFPLLHLANDGELPPSALSPGMCEALPTPSWSGWTWPCRMASLVVLC